MRNYRTTGNVLVMQISIKTPVKHLHVAYMEEFIGILAIHETHTLINVSTEDIGSLSLFSNI
jgi:hypothetical protein